MFDLRLKAQTLQKLSFAFLERWVNFENLFLANKCKLILRNFVGSAWTDFKPQIENLPKLLPDYQIIFCDPPGLGKSIPPERNCSTDFLDTDADVVKSLMDTLGVAKFSVLGWSDGGTSAMILAGKYPESVEKLIVFATLAYLTVSEIKIYKYCSDGRNWNDELRKPLEEIYGREYFLRKCKEINDYKFAVFRDRKGDLCKKSLKDITAETLILYGAKDMMVSKEHPTFLQRSIANSKLITYPNGTHDIHLKNADDFNKKVADFMLNESFIMKQ